MGFNYYGNLMAIIFLVASFSFSPAEVQLTSEMSKERFKHELSKALVVEEQTRNYAMERLSTLNISKAQKWKAIKIFSSYQCRMNKLWVIISDRLKAFSNCDPVGGLAEFNGKNLRKIFSKEVLDLIEAYLDLVDPLVDNVETLADTYFARQRKRT